jgi:hypothetical protein
MIPKTETTEKYDWSSVVQTDDNQLYFSVVSVFGIISSAFYYYPFSFFLSFLRNAPPPLAEVTINSFIHLKKSAFIRVTHVARKQATSK